MGTIKSREKSKDAVADILKGKPADSDKLFSYFKVFMGDRGVAAITPSSRYLVRRVMKALDLDHAKDVIEYGAAQGVMTRTLLGKIHKDSKILAIELNKNLFDSLREISDPRLTIYNGDVREIDEIARRFGVGSADVIFSGIPFAFLSPEDRHTLLKKTSQLLRPGGRFVAYQVTTHLIPLLKRHFKKVRIELEIRNLPPHFVFTAFK
ncbi:MAG: methyltransferase domain-containing protein [Elusimicrobia bacterium]|nr:methyltransferase domain-containing protein [Elusimicrobiota bacterium]